MSKKEARSDSDISDVSDEQEWLNEDDDEGDEETVQVISLLDDRVFPDAMSMVSYCKEKYGFDFLAVRDRLQLDFHGTVKLINFSELQSLSESSPASYSPLLQSATASTRARPFRTRSLPRTSRTMLISSPSLTTML